MIGFGNANALQTAQLFEAAAEAYERLTDLWAASPRPNFADSGELSYMTMLLAWGLRLDHLGHTGEARQYMDKAIRWIDSSTKDKPKDDTFGARIGWERWLALQVLRREAESLVKGSRAAGLDRVAAALVTNGMVS